MHFSEIKIELIFLQISIAYKQRSKIFCLSICAMLYALHAAHATLYSLLFLTSLRIQSFLPSRGTISDQSPHFSHCSPKCKFSSSLLFPATSYRCPPTPLIVTVCSALRITPAQLALSLPVKPTQPFTSLPTSISLCAHPPTQYTISLSSSLILFANVSFLWDTVSKNVCKSVLVSSSGRTPANSGLQAGVAVSTFVRVKGRLVAAEAPINSFAGADGEERPLPKKPRPRTFLH